MMQVKEQVGSLSTTWVGGGILEWGHNGLERIDFTCETCKTLCIPHVTWEFESYRDRIYQNWDFKRSNIVWGELLGFWMYREETCGEPNLADGVFRCGSSVLVCNALVALLGAQQRCPSGPPYLRRWDWRGGTECSPLILGKSSGWKPKRPQMWLERCYKHTQSKAAAHSRWPDWMRRRRAEWPPACYSMDET